MIQKILQQQIIGDAATDWSRTAEFNQFDPSLGTLQNIDVGLTADVSGSVTIESLEASPSTVLISQSADLSVTSPTGVVLVSAAPGASGFVSLAADNGSAGSAIPLATLLLANTATAATSLHQGSIDLGPFIGTGWVPLAVDASTTLHVNGPGNMVISSYASAGATVDLRYDYAGDGPGGGYTGSFSGSTVSTLRDGVFPYFFGSSVTTASQTFTLADRTTGWSDSLAVDEFDPMLGTLEAINITLGGDLSTKVMAENGDANAATVSATQAATLTLTLPGTSESTGASSATSMVLGGYDGTPDYAGASGRIDQSHTQMATITNQLTDATDLAALTGLGTLSLPISATGASSLDGPGNLMAELLAQAGATVTVSYTYLPRIPVSDTMWTDGAGGQWNNVANWSSAPNAPGPGDDIAITLPGTYALDLGTTETVHSVIIDAPGATVVLDANLTVAGDFILDAGTIVFNGGTLSAGEIDINGGLISGHAVDIQAGGSIALNGGRIVAASAVLQADAWGTSGIIRAVGSSGVVTTAVLARANLTFDSATSLAPYLPYSPGAVKLTSDNTSFHSGASGDRVTMSGNNDAVMGGAGADTVFAQGADAWCHGGTGSLLFVGGSGDANTVVGASGASTLFGGSGDGNVLAAGKGTALVVAGSGGALIYGGSGNASVAGSDGSTTVVGGAGDMTVFAGKGPMLVYGGTGSLVFGGGANGGGTVVGGSGAATLFGGSGGNSVLLGGTAQSIIKGGGNGDLLVGGGSAGDLIYAGGGNETLVGSSTGNDLLVGGSGNDAIFAGGGNDSIVAGTGNAQMVAGSGSDLFNFTNGQAGGNDIIWDFSQGTDHVMLSNYAPDIVASALSSAVTSSGSTTIMLPDSTRITFGGIAQLHVGDFV